MDKKDIISVIAWIVGAVIWAVIACDNFAQSNTVYAVLQVVLSVGFLINAIRCYIKAKKANSA